jgi:hypothetical protein
VWNHCNGAQVHALTHNQKWPGKAELASLTKGAGKLIGIPAQTIQGVVAEYVDRRRATRKAKLRWRGKRCLGWIPFKNQTIVLAGSVVRFNGHKLLLWKHRGIDGRIKSGNFAQAAPAAGIATSYANSRLGHTVRTPQWASISASRTALRRAEPRTLGRNSKLFYRSRAVTP